MPWNYGLSRAASLLFLEHRNLSTKFPILHLLKASCCCFLDSVYQTPSSQRHCQEAELYSQISRMLWTFQAVSSLPNLFPSSLKAILPSQIQPTHFPLHSHSLYSTNFTKPSSIMRFRLLTQKPSFLLPTSHIPSLRQWSQNQILTWIGKGKGKNTMWSLKLC